MRNKIFAIISVFLVFALVFSFAGCTTEQETETTTYKIKTPLPEDPTEGTNEKGETITDPTYSAEQLDANTTDIFDYFLGLVNGLGDDKAIVTKSIDKSIGKAKNDKEEEVPMSENDYINVAIETLAPYMFNEDGEEFDAKTPLTESLPIDEFAALTREDVKSATSSYQGQFRVITITLNNPMDVHSVDESILENFNDAKVKEYMTITEDPSYMLKECQIIVTVLVETDEITRIEYIKNADVKTSVKGEGTLKDVAETPVEFRYVCKTAYDINREIESK